MEKEKRREEIINSYTGSFVETIDDIISQEKAMIKAAEDNAVLKFAEEIYDFVVDPVWMDVSMAESIYKEINKLLEARALKKQYRTYKVNSPSRGVSK